MYSAQRWTRVSICAALVTGLAAVAGCELPKAPEWEIGAVVPFSSDPLAIVDFLPPQVDTARVAGQPVFALAPQQSSVGLTLRDICGCNFPPGNTTTVPTIDYVDSLHVAFPADLVSIELVSGRLALRLWNGLGFDPLSRISGGDTAFIAVTARDLGTGARLDSLLISGADETLPLAPDSAQLDLGAAGATMTDGFRIVVHLYSPDDGRTIEFRDTLRIEVSATLEEALIEAVTVVVDNESLEENFVVEFEGGAREEIADLVESAAYDFQLIHDGEVEGDLQASIAGSESGLFSGDPAREVRLINLAFTPDVMQSGELSAEEIQLIAGFAEVFVGYRGVATGTRTGAGNRTKLSRFRADQSLETRLRVTSRIRVGG